MFLPQKLQRAPDGESRRGEGEFNALLGNVCGDDQHAASWEKQGNANSWPDFLVMRTRGPEYLVRTWEWHRKGESGNSLSLVLEEQERTRLVRTPGWEE